MLERFEQVNTTSTSRSRRVLQAFTAAVLVLPVSTGGVSGVARDEDLRVQAPSAGTAASPTVSAWPHHRTWLRVRAAARSVTLKQSGGHVRLALGFNVVAGTRDFSVISRRRSYSSAPRSYLVTESGRILLPRTAVTDFEGINRFFRLTVFSPDGGVLLRRYLDFCPGGSQEPTRLGTKGTSTYPRVCPTHPYTRGAVFGVAAGFAITALGPIEPSVVLSVGRYTARLNIAQPYRRLMDQGKRESNDRVHFNVVSGGKAACASRLELQRPCSRTEGTAATPDALPLSSDVGSSPTAGTSTGLHLPDLRSLPAYNLELNGPRLRFASTVWNAGSSDFVVEAYRVPRRDVMAGYQVTSTASGDRKRYKRAGHLVWDDSDGHQHWHLHSFARYELLNAKRSVVVSGHKAGFCLADTDPIDLTVFGAKWQPYPDRSFRSCGDYASLGTRQVLSSGWGDTYDQYLPGQSFNVAGLPNGRYYVRISANPDGLWWEDDYENNVSYRALALRGDGPNRHLVVSPVGKVRD